LLEVVGNGLLNLLFPLASSTQDGSGVDDGEAWDPSVGEEMASGFGLGWEIWDESTGRRCTHGYDDLGPNDYEFRLKTIPTVIHPSLSYLEVLEGFAGEGVGPPDFVSGDSNKIELHFRDLATRSAKRHTTLILVCSGVLAHCEDLCNFRIARTKDHLSSLHMEWALRAVFPLFFEFINRGRFG
jgi:hypothetical protein